MFLSGALLVVGLAHQRGNIRLDHPASTGEECQRDQESRLVFDPEDEVAENVRNREADDRPVFPEEAIGEIPPQEREEIAGHLEGVKDRTGLALVEVQDGGEVQRENGPHAVVRGPFREFSPEEEIEGFRMVCRDRIVD